MSAAPAALASPRRSFVAVLAPYLEFSRVGFVNILAFRLRYYTGILTYIINVTVYYFIWRAVFAQSSPLHRRLRPRPDSHLRFRRLDHPFVLLEHH